MHNVPTRFRVVRFDRVCEERRHWWTLAVLIVLCALVPLAYASPPDPVWIAGIYDAADNDDTVLAATSQESRVEEGLRVERPARIIEDIVPAVGLSVVPPILRRSQPRAPPAS
jgi:hypothetical protein